MIELKQISRFFIAALAISILLISLAACTYSTSEMGNTVYSPAPQISTQDGGNVEAFTSSIASNGWQNGENYQWTFENTNGYTGSVSIKFWIGRRGNGIDMAHPGISSMVIPARNNDTCVIPFEFTITNTTTDPSFKAELYFGVGSSSSYDSGKNATNNDGVFVYTSDGWRGEDWINDFDEGVVRYWSSTSSGFATTQYGYCVVEDYYSPKYPDGNVDMLATYYSSWGTYEKTSDSGALAFSLNASYSRLFSSHAGLGGRRFALKAINSVIEIVDYETKDDENRSVTFESTEDIGIEITEKIGDIIRIGNYDWRILDIQNGKALVISELVIEQRAYNAVYAELTWADCDLRTYLNTGFYNTLNADEQAIIENVTIRNPANPQYGNGGDDTTDKIFLLSLDEAHSYFADNSARIAYNANGESQSWWLRSPGQYKAYALYVMNTLNPGHIANGGGTVTLENIGVRPAMWIKLDGATSIGS